jgi:hypothetical protein
MFYNLGTNCIGPRSTVDGPQLGNGRVVIVAEAAMFSAQLAGEQKFKMGMNEPVAKHNAQLLLNIIHYLDGILD